jgi:crotonobetainyl-CoA:carnitine CoA-transferase CaiB-like acyl-CoA transferase
MPALVDAMDEVLKTRSRDEWGAIFDEAKLIWGPVLTLDEVAGDPQANAIDMFPELEHPELGPYRTVRAPLRMASADLRPRGPAPVVGEHTRQVLSDVGLSDDEIAALAADGVIGGA